MMVGSIYREKLFEKLFYALIEFEKFYIQISWEVDGEKHLWENKLSYARPYCVLNNPW